MEKILIPEKATSRIIWEDDPQNYSKQKQKELTSIFSKKYNTNNIQVVFKPKKVKTTYGEVEMSVTESVMDPIYQRKLFKEWLDTSNITIDWDKLIRLDEKVNEKLNEDKDIEYRYRNWSLKWLEINNFLSYGDDNFVDYEKLKGITSISSEPKNMGGKTVFSVHAIMFLFFNNTEITKTALDVFNRYRENKDEVKVKGCINIDGVDYIIERVVTRKQKKNSDEYTVKTDLNFHKILPDGSIENLEGEQRRETDELIKKSIGSYEDFMLTIIATSDNLDDLIFTKPTERGRLLSRFIGLEVIEQKETIVKDMKSKWSKNLKSDLYNSIDLTNEITTLNNEIDTNNKSIVEKQELIDSKVVEIKETNDIKDTLISQKIEIDKEILKLRPDDIDKEIQTITKKGFDSKDRLNQQKELLNTLSEIEFDETIIKKLRDEDKVINNKVTSCEIEIRNLEKLITQLEKGDICPTCKRSLDDVDHTDEINQHKEKTKELKINLESFREESTNILTQIKEQEEIKKKSDEWDRTNLVIDKLELELDNMRLQLKEKKDLKLKYDNNVESIQKNLDLDTKILGYSSKLERISREKDQLIRDIENHKSQITIKENKILTNNSLIESIKNEEDIKKTFDVYIQMIGKNGISKLVMKTVIPMLNSEINRLLIDTVNFKVLVNINDNNEVEFLLETEDLNEDGSSQIVQKQLITGSGFEKTVSSLALRTVLSKVSCLPKPNILVYDEVLGRVANENLEYVGNFFKKCSEMFDNIFIITHNELVKDWANHTITVNKINNISNLVVK